MILNKDFREFIASLNDNSVEYLIVGGYAVNLHGYPRYTKDIDYWVKPEDHNIERLLSAISDFGFDSLELTKEDFSNPEDIVQLGRAPRRIDLLTSIDGIEFIECYSRKKVVDVDGLKLQFLNIEDLIVAKKTSGRLQDLADAEQLQKIRDQK